MSKVDEEILEEFSIPTDDEDYLKINLDKGTIRAPKNDRNLINNIDKKKAISMLSKSKIDEKQLTASGLLLLCLMYERGVNINTLVRNSITEREALNILYLLEKGSVLPKEIKGNLRKEPLESKLKLNTKVIKGKLKKQVIKLATPVNGMGDNMVPRTYWVCYDNDIEFERVLGYKKGK